MISQKLILDSYIILECKFNFIKCHKIYLPKYLHDFTQFMFFYFYIVFYSLAGKFKPFMDFNVSIFIFVFAGIQLAPAYIVTAVSIIPIPIYLFVLISSAQIQNLQSPKKIIHRFFYTQIIF